ncbi:hypothetical protein [Jeotgalibacillus marinus]|uniref:Uncharacterized protein n=1 Tax=Jeotgalibacillus marinus TaxID=86667 RepID=A0ABV3Q6U4_9BACL
MFEMREGYRVVAIKRANGRFTKCVLDKHDKIVEKKCTGCLEIKGLERFNKNSANKFDGRIQKCKKCDAEYSIKYHVENKERNRKYDAKKREQLAEHRRKYDEEKRKRLAKWDRYG